MKYLSLILSFVVLSSLSSFLLAEQSSDLVVDEHRENEWIVGYITESSIHAQVNGLVTHGDSLDVRFVKDACDTGNLLTYVYSMANHPKILQLEDKYVSANFMGEEIIARILFTQPFLGGHRSIIDLGWIPLEDLTKILLRQDPIKMKFFDSDDIRITEYFDIHENSWSNRGLLDALLRASSMCKGL